MNTKVVNKRTDGKFTKISKSKITSVRRMKLDGFSLSEIAKSLNVSKSTASIYCRDLFDYPGRIYATEQEIRGSILERGRGKSHSLYRPCINCGALIRNERRRCVKCNSINPVNRYLGQRQHCIMLKEQIKTRVSQSSGKNRKHDYRFIWTVHINTNMGGQALSSYLGIPKSTLGQILSKIRRNPKLVEMTEAKTNRSKDKGVSCMEDRMEWHYKRPNGEELEKALKELG